MVRRALVNEQAPGPIGPGMAEDPRIDPGGRNGPALEGFRFRVKAHEGIGAHAGFVVPNDAVDDNQPIGMGFRTARGGPLPKAPRGRDVLAEASGPGVDVPNAAVVSDIEAANVAFLVGQINARLRQGVRVDAVEAGASIASHPGLACPVELDAVGPALRSVELD